MRSLARSFIRSLVCIAMGQAIYVRNWYFNKSIPYNKFTGNYCNPGPMSFFSAMDINLLDYFNPNAVLSIWIIYFVNQWIFSLPKIKEIQTKPKQSCMLYINNVLFYGGFLSSANIKRLSNKFMQSQWLFLSWMYKKEIPLVRTSNARIEI